MPFALPFSSAMSLSSSNFPKLFTFLSMKCNFTHTLLFIFTYEISTRNPKDLRPLCTFATARLFQLFSINLLLAFFKFYLLCTFIGTFINFFNVSARMSFFQWFQHSHLTSQQTLYKNYPLCILIYFTFIIIIISL